MVSVPRRDFPPVTFEAAALHELKKIVTLLRLLIHEQARRSWE
jgi:hypothetical protein